MLLRSYHGEVKKEILIPTGLLTTMHKYYKGSEFLRVFLI